LKTASKSPWNWDVLWNSSFLLRGGDKYRLILNGKRTITPKGCLFQNKMDGDESLVVLQKQLMINSTTHLNPFSLQDSQGIPAQQ